jgi:hypothetical protein
MGEIFVVIMISTVMITVAGLIGLLAWLRRQR